MYYLAPKCLYRGEYKRIQLRVLSPSRMWEHMNGFLCALYILCCLIPSVSFYSPRGGLGLQGICVSISFNRGMVLT